MFKPSLFTRLDFHSPLWQCGWRHTFPKLREESFDIPATLVDEKLMLTAYVCNIQYNSRPNSLLFLFNQHTAFDAIRSVNTSALRHLYGLLLAVLETRYTNLV